MYAIDSDTLTLFLGGNQKVVRRILDTPKADLWLPAIVVEERLRGRLAFLSSLNSSRPADSLKLPAAYNLLLESVRELNGFQYLPYTAEAEALFQSWPASAKRVRTRDCRIAASDIVHGFTVITCNLSHFQTIPGVRLEDWSAQLAFEKGLL